MSSLVTELRGLLSAAALSAVLAVPVHAQSPLPEAQVKAGFILNFARFVDWPERAFASRDAPFVLCVIGADTLGSALTALESKQIQRRTIKLRRGVTAEDARACHVVFIAESEHRRLVTILRTLAGHPVLTVSDMDGFIDAGGAIGIVPGDERLMFEVNRGALDQAQLMASSQLLKLARNAADLKTRN